MCCCRSFCLYVSELIIVIYFTGMNVDKEEARLLLNLQLLNNVIIIKTKVLLPQILQFLNNVIIIKTKVLLPQILQFLNNVIIIKTKVLLPKPILAILF